MSSYDRVAVSDKRPITSDGHDYSDDPYGSNDKHANGNGVYNDYTVQLEPKQYSSSFTFCCFNCKNTKRAKCVMIISLVLVLLSVILIVVSAVTHKSSGKENQNKDTKQFGLFAYGPDDHGNVNYKIHDSNEYMAVFNRISHHVHEYSSVTQWSQPNKYIKCEDFRSMVFTPNKDKVCMQTMAEFGNNCQNQELYGIVEGRPCILLVLKLREGFLPELYNLTGTENKELQEKLQGRGDNMSVPITCEGKTEKDKSAMETHLLNASGSDLGSMNNMAGPAISFKPERGYPLYFFRQKERNADYINPAVMVQFNTLPTKKPVTITCTAWATNFEPKEDYTVEFTFSIDA